MRGQVSSPLLEGQVSRLYWHDNILVAQTKHLISTPMSVSVINKLKPFVSFLFSDGVGRTGAFMTIYSQLERLKVEQTADIFQFVKASRLKRKGLIRQLVSAHFNH